MNPGQQFDDQNLMRAEAILLAHEVARDYFQGELYDRHNNRLQGMTLERQADACWISTKRRLDACS